MDANEITHLERKHAVNAALRERAMYSVHVATNARGDLQMVVSRAGIVVHQQTVSPPIVDDYRERLALALEALAEDLRISTVSHRPASTPCV